MIKKTYCPLILSVSLSFSFSISFSKPTIFAFLTGQRYIMFVSFHAHIETFWRNILHDIWALYTRLRAIFLTTARFSQLTLSELLFRKNKRTFDIRRVLILFARFFSVQLLELREEVNESWLRGWIELIQVNLKFFISMFHSRIYVQRELSNIVDLLIASAIRFKSIRSVLLSRIKLPLRDVTFSMLPIISEASSFLWLHRI